MKRSAKEHRQEYKELGYTVFEGVLSPREVAAAIPIFDELITPDTKPPKVTGDDTARRQLNSGKFCEPRLSAYGAHPAVLETVAALIDGPFRLSRTPVPTVTFTGAAGGLPGKGWTGHVDWDRTGEINVLHLYGIIYFTTVQPEGGGFTVIPGSHRVIANHLVDPAVAPRMFVQDFSGVAGLAREVEIRGNAGDVLYYHPLMIHGASDNTRPQARKVLHTHYFPILEAPFEQREREKIPQRFHADHLAAMDERTKKLIGLTA